jgi:Phage tail assembly chaperone protein
MSAPVLPTALQMASMKRNFLIQSCEWMRFRHSDEKALSLSTTLSDAQYTQLLTYIQALRACMNGVTDATTIVWPTAPSFIS